MSEITDTVPDAPLRIDPPDFERLHPNARWTLRIGGVLGAAMPATGAAIALTVLGSARFDIPAGQAVLVAAAGVLLACVLGWLWADAAFARTRYRLDATGLEIHRGVFWRTQTRVPRTRVQHTDINRGPIDRRLGLAALKVYTAGTRMASVDLDGVGDARALELRDALLAGADDVL
jgi:uncharacterized protein